MTALPKQTDFDLPAKWRDLVDLGFSVFPVEHGGKKPVEAWKSYQTACASADTVRAWAARRSNIGIATGAISGLIVLDLDSDAAISEAESRGLPDTLTVRTAKGLHVYFSHPGGTVGNRAGLLPGTDIRGDGGYVVAPGSLHETGATYDWEKGPGDYKLAPLPAWLATLLAKPEPKNDNVSRLPLVDRTTKWAGAAIDKELATLRAAPEGQRNAQLNKSAFSLGQLSRHINVSSTLNLLRATAEAIGLGTVEIEATLESGWTEGEAQPRDMPPARALVQHSAEHNAETGKSNPRRSDPSEDDIALAFTALHGETLKFDHDVGAWFEWDGARWRQDNSHRAFTYGREMARKFGAAGKASFAGGVERFAQADRAHAVNATIWDQNTMLLGTPGGTVDLRTGDYFSARPADYITKLAGCTPEHGEPTLWLRFLNEALGGDQEAIRFLRLWAGYCLTGDTREHALIFLHGLAGTGKTVFLNTLAAILGDYAVTAAMETFTASKFDRHSTELAMLRGARLVTASETEEGRAWAEARVKQMTGGDPITARFMRQDNFTFRPQFKLTIVGNHAPRLTNPDDAMRRRFNILGFNIKPTAPDLQLEHKLEAEHGRILAWAIAGCREWQRTGLVRPAAVTEATSEYFAGEDLMGQWLADCCNIQHGKFELPAKLYADWAKYAEANGEDPGTAIAFGKKMKKRGLESKASNGLRAYRGVELLHSGPYNVD